MTRLLSPLACAVFAVTTLMSVAPVPAQTPQPAAPTPGPATTRPAETITPLAEPVIGPPVKAWDNARAVTTIGFGSCLRQNRPQPIWATINNDRPDLFLFLGDNIYGDSENMGILRAKYQTLLEAPGFRELREASTCLATWDDHDFGLNDAGVEFAAKRDSQVQFHNFWGLPASSPLREREGVYSAHTFGPAGQRVQVLLLDTRYFRSPLVTGDPSPFGRYLPTTDPTSTLLGAAQWAWLEGELKKPADVRVIASSIQVLADGHRFEKWGNFPHERTRLINLLGTATGTVIVVSGDRHSGEFSTTKLPDGRDLYDLTSSALNQGSGTGNPNAEPNPLRTGDRINVPHYGLITIDWAARSAEFQLKDADRSVRVTSKVPLQP